MRIFASYASEDRAVVEPAVFALRSDGHEVFLDRDDLQQGQSYHDKIQNEIAAADLAVVFASANFMRPGKYTLTELGFIRARWPSPSEVVLPVIVDETPTSELDAYLRAVTILQPSGNLAAEVLGAVRKMAKGHRRLTPLVRYGLPAAVLVGLLVLTLWLAGPVLWPPGKTYSIKGNNSGTIIQGDNNEVKE